MRPPLRAALLLAAAATAGATGCASAARGLVRPYALAPSGLELPEQRLRDALGGGRWDAALRQAGRPRDGGPSDRLLRELYRGTAAYYAGRWDESGLAFGRAAALADDRYTKRVSRGALALATNDRALPYVPGDNERLFAHYYAALGYLHARDLNGAAVEARRLAYRLQQAEARRDPLDRSARATLRYLTGAVFELSGDREDALVAYRNAAALGAAVDTAAVAGAAPRMPAGPATGEVLVLVESGFVAHRVNQRLEVRLDDGVAREARAEDAMGAESGPGTLGARLTRLLSGDAGLWAGDPVPALALDAAPGDSAPAGSDGEAADTTVGVPGRGVADVIGPMPRPPQAPPAAAQARGGARPAGRWRAPVWRTFVVAWPAYRRPAPGWGALGVAAGSLPAPAAVTAAAASTGVATAFAAAGPPALARADLSLAAAGDFRRDRGKLLARLVSRAVLRAALAREAGRRDRALGDAVRLVANVVEQADTRSWHLLPAEVRLVRLRLPAGAQPLAVTLDGRRLALGTVRVAPGGLHVVSARVWDAAGARVTAFGVDRPPGSAPAAAGAAAE